MKSTHSHSQVPSFRLFFSSDAYFQAICKEIRRAHHEILMESYIFNLDPIGYQILGELATARQRGVHVRLLVDGIGSFNWSTQLAKECEEKKVALRIYHPLPFQTRVLSGFSWRSIRRLLRIFRTMNKRNHRKLIVIDERMAFLGSQNISQVHSERFMGAKAWRDTALQVEFQEPASEIDVLRSAFYYVWGRARGFRLLRRAPLRSLMRTWQSPSNLFRLNSYLNWRFGLSMDLRRRISSSKNRILITNPYFLPRRSILVALKKAARRGVFVGLCLPEKNDVWLVRMASRSLYLSLLKDGVHIFEYKPRVLHSKTLVIDNWATVGSHNMNHRSFVHDLEVDAVLEDPLMVKQLVEQWDQDVRQSEVITEKNMGRVTLLNSLISKFFYWFRYWL